MAILGSFRANRNLKSELTVNRVTPIKTKELFDIVMQVVAGRFQQWQQ